MNKRIFHVHTFRCGHMRDEERETAYIEKAIELGATEIFFTDHAPFPGDEFRNRMKINELPEYVSTLQKLKQEYADRIDVKIGLEIEYLPNFHKYYEQLRDSGNFDTLLLGQHFSLLPDGRYSFQDREKVVEARVLADGIIEGMESGFFQVVAHPDQIFRRCKEWDEETENIAREIIECAARTGVILEQNISNMQGKKKKRAYRPEFWAELPAGVRTIYGLDAHSMEELEENYLLQQALTDKEINRIGTKLIDEHMEVLKKMAEEEV